MKHRLLLACLTIGSGLLFVGRVHADLPVQPDFEVQSNPEVQSEFEQSSMRTGLLGCGLAVVAVAAGLLTLKFTRDQNTS